MNEHTQAPPGTYAIGEDEHYLKCREMPEIGKMTFYLCKECGDTTATSSLRDFGYSHEEGCSLEGGAK